MRLCKSWCFVSFSLGKIGVGNFSVDLRFHLWWDLGLSQEILVACNIALDIGMNALPEVLGTMKFGYAGSGILCIITRLLPIPVVQHLGLPWNLIPSLCQSSGCKVTWDLSGHVTWSLSQEPLPVEKSHNSQWGNWRVSATTRSQAEWFLWLWWLPSWELCDFSLGMGSCFYSMTHGNEHHSVLGNHAMRNTPFLHWFKYLPWDKFSVWMSEFSQDFCCFWWIYLWKYNIYPSEDRCGLKKQAGHLAEVKYMLAVFLVSFS